MGDSPLGTGRYSRIFPGTRLRSGCCPRIIPGIERDLAPLLVSDLFVLVVDFPLHK